jgi:hypothetical protein
MKNLAFVAALVLLAGCQSTPPAPAVIDPAIVITEPAADVPAEYAAFSGVWGGTWGSDLDGKLAVQTISTEGAAVVYYAVGDLPGFFKAQGYLKNGQITGRKLVVPLNEGIRATYTMQPDGTLAGEYNRQGNITRGMFTKQ